MNFAFLDQLKNNSVPLAALLRGVQKYWLIMLLAVLVIGVGTFYVSTYLVQKTYQATASILALNNKEDSSDGKDSSSMTYTTLMMANLLINDYKEILSSRRVLDKVDAKVCEAKNITEPPKYKLSVNFKRNTRILEISATSNDKDLSLQVATATTDIFTSEIRDLLKMDNVVTLDDPKLEDAPVSPRPLRNTAIAMVLALLLSGGVVFLKEISDDSVKTPEDITETLKLPVIGTIPEAGSKKSRRRSADDAKQPRHKRLDFVGLFSIDEKYRHISEAFRLLRTNLQYLTPENAEQNAKVFTITSAMASEGKSSCCANMALITAQSGKRVLLIDTDLRKPNVQNFFELDRRVGLVNYLSGDAKLEEIINRQVVDEHLDVILSGPIPPNPSELLMSETFQKMVKTLGTDYDFIFFDAPPCLNMADATIVASNSDGVIFVLRHGSTRMGAVQRAIRQFQQTGIKVHGVLLNRFDMKRVGYGYYNYYNYYNYYSYYQTDGNKEA